jgi:hypothetical protein
MPHAATWAKKARNLQENSEPPESALKPETTAKHSQKRERKIKMPTYIFDVLPDAPPGGYASPEARLDPSKPFFWFVGYDGGDFYATYLDPQGVSVGITEPLQVSVEMPFPFPPNAQIYISVRQYLDNSNATDVWNNVSSNPTPTHTRWRCTNGVCEEYPAATATEGYAN